MGLLYVESDGFFVAVDPDEMAAESVANAFVVLPDKVAGAGAFDFDDTGAEVGEVASCEGEGDDLFEGYYGEVFEGAGGGGVEVEV